MRRLAKPRGAPDSRSVDRPKGILLDKVAVINRRTVQGILNVAQLVDGAHRLSAFSLDVGGQSHDRVEHHLVGGYFAEVLDQVLGVLAQRWDVALDDGLLFARK
jgi:hypothetical protein